MHKNLRNKSNRPSAIVLIVFCFVASVFVRIADSAPAFAEAVGGQSKLEDAANPLDFDHEMASSCAPVEEPSALLLALKTRQDQITEREAYIDSREQTLRVAETRIEQQLAALRGAEERLAATLALADNAAENDVAQLTEVYERMKPGDAAGIFETMDIQFAAGFFARMRPEAAANIMAELPSDLAYSISVVMAGRNANAPRE